MTINWLKKRPVLNVTDRMEGGRNGVQQEGAGGEGGRGVDGISRGALESLDDGRMVSENGLRGHTS
jgi:hypothetical protein